MQNSRSHAAWSDRGLSLNPSTEALNSHKKLCDKAENPAQRRTLSFTSRGCNWIGPRILTRSLCAKTLTRPTQPAKIDKCKN